MATSNVDEYGQLSIAIEDAENESLVASVRPYKTGPQFSATTFLDQSFAAGSLMYRVGLNGPVSVSDDPALQPGLRLMVGDREVLATLALDTWQHPGDLDYLTFIHRLQPGDAGAVSLLGIEVPEGGAVTAHDGASGQYVDANLGLGTDGNSASIHVYPAFDTVEDGAITGTGDNRAILVDDPAAQWPALLDPANAAALAGERGYLGIVVSGSAGSPLIFRDHEENGEYLGVDVWQADAVVGSVLRQGEGYVLRQGGTDYVVPAAIEAMSFILVDADTGQMVGKGDIGLKPGEFAEPARPDDIVVAGGLMSDGIDLSAQPTIARVDVYPGGGDDTVTGHAGSDWVFPSHGDDVVDAGGGDDTLFFGRGDDVLDGGAGRDRLVLDLGTLLDKVWVVADAQGNISYQVPWGESGTYVDAYRITPNPGESGVTVEGLSPATQEVTSTARVTGVEAVVGQGNGLYRHLSALHLDGPRWAAHAEPLFDQPPSHVPGQTVRFSLPVTATDPDGDALTYTAEVGILAGTTFLPITDLPAIPLGLDPADPTRLTGEGSVPATATPGEYVLRVYADDDPADGWKGAPLDVVFQVREAVVVPDDQIIRVSVDGEGKEWDWLSLMPSISADGGRIAFLGVSTASVEDIEAPSDVSAFLWDSQTGVTSQILVAGDAADFFYEHLISADGRYLAIANGGILLHDLETGLARPLSQAADGGSANGDSHSPSINADGHYLAFISDASNLVVGDTNGMSDVFVVDTETGETRLISVASDGSGANGDSEAPFISADGRHVAFASDASNLVAGDTEGSRDIFVRDLDSGVTQRVAALGKGASPVLSANGRVLAFEDRTAGRYPWDDDSQGGIVVHDLQTGATIRLPGTEHSNAESPSISADGRYVAYVNWASEVVAGTTYNVPDVYVYDRDTGITQRVSVSEAGEQAGSNSSDAQISADGRYVVFSSPDDDFVEQDHNPFDDIFRAPNPLYAAADPEPASDSATLDVSVSYWAGRHGMEGVEVRLAPVDGGLSTLASTEQDGRFHFIGLAEGRHALAAHRPDSGIDAAVDLRDAHAALRLAAGMDPDDDPATAMDACQYLAADVNQDGRVTSADALAILKMIVGLDETRPAWGFVEADAISAASRTHVPHPAAPEVTPGAGEVQLVGFILGDVDGSWASA